jgi:hypothetical protein
MSELKPATYGAQDLQVGGLNPDLGGDGAGICTVNISTH